MTSEPTLLDRIERFPAVAGRPAYFVLSLAADDLPALAAALRKSGRPTHGPALEAAFVRVIESDDPPWASELEFDSEADAFTVRCRRRTPLAHLARRMERRLTKPLALRRLVRSLPQEP